MSTSRLRAHVIIPEDVLKEVDELVGPRGRSEFITAAARDRLERMRLRETVRELGGSLSNQDIPGWETNESAAQWVHNLRREGGTSEPHEEASPP